MYDDTIVGFCYCAGNMNRMPIIPSRYFHFVLYGKIKFRVDVYAIKMTQPASATLYRVISSRDGTGCRSRHHRLLLGEWPMMMAFIGKSPPADLVYSSSPRQAFKMIEMQHYSKDDYAARHAVTKFFGECAQSLKRAWLVMMIRCRPVGFITFCLRLFYSFYDVTATAAADAALLVSMMGID